MDSLLFLHLSYLSCLSRLSYHYRAQVSTYT
ncbi:iron ABC transporter permease [Streptococcus pneumoniae]|nr:iron ABC transporter permease [Streptococcus pneumoniae]OKQ56313.1 iron ABC transporter permease [Streptococcus pneumoniae]